MSTAAIARRQLDKDVTVEKILLNGKKIDPNIVASVVDGEIERTMDGASTLTLTVHDPELALLKSGIFSQRVILVIDKMRFMLAKVSKSGDSLTLVFEDFEVAVLRKYDKPRKATRGKVTRAQFVLSLVREARPRVKFFSPEMNKRQPIASSVDRPSKDEKDANREPGFSSDVEFTVQGVKATREQIANAERALDVARSKDASRLVQVTLVMAMIQESRIRNLTYGHSSSVGILQLLDSWLGGSTSTKGGRRDIELVVGMFLDRGFTGRGGAIAIAKRAPNTDPAVIATMVQGNAGGSSDYAPWRQEAERIVNLYNGGDGSLSEGATNSGASGKYEFTRGQPGEREDTWSAAQRLAEEVNWRCFMVAGTLYFVSDEYLIRSRPLMTINRDTIGVEDIDFDLDVGKKAQTASVICRIDRWAAPPGSVVVINKMGPANGRWLVQSVRRPLFSADGEIELRRAEASLPEPPAETSTSSSGSEGLGIVGGAVAKINGDGTASAPEDAPDEVKAMIAAGNKIHTKPYGHANHAADYDVHSEYDCSSSAAFLLLAGGFVSDGVNYVSGTFEGMFEPGPGRWITVYANDSHCYVEVAGIRFDTSPHGSQGVPAGSGPRWRTKIGPRPGFAVRHPGGF